MQALLAARHGTVALGTADPNPSDKPGAFGYNPVGRRGRQAHLFTRDATPLSHHVANSLAYLSVRPDLLLNHDSGTEHDRDFHYLSTTQNSKKKNRESFPLYLDRKKASCWTPRATLESRLSVGQVTVNRV